MKQRIIIIGGMGPQASLELHRRMIQQALADGAKDGTDFPHIVHLSLPVLLGCTELSCAFAEKPNTIDPMNILLRYLITKGVL